MPQTKLAQWKQERELWLAAHPEPHDEAIRREFYERFTERFQRGLDAGYGSCILAKPAIKQVIENALRFFDGTRYRLDEHIVMPNHVHALVTPLEEHQLSNIVRSWKSFTAHTINRMLGKSGACWQKESFDHIVRNARQMDRLREYIRNNPKPRRDIPRQRPASVSRAVARKPSLQ